MTSHHHIARMQQMSAQQQYDRNYIPRTTPLPSHGSIMSGNSSQRHYSDNNQLYANLPPAPSVRSNDLAENIYSPPLPPARQHSEMEFGDADYQYRRQTSTYGSYGRKTYSRASLGVQSHLSRSLGASKASLVSAKSGKTSIQQEFHDRKVMNFLKSPKVGKARKPYVLSIIFFILALLVFTTGLTLICLRYIYWNIFLTHDREEAIGPCLMALSFAVLGLSIKFLYDAYKIGARERNRLKFQAANASFVNVVAVNTRAPDRTQHITSGTATQNAITRSPHGSRSTLNVLGAYPASDI